MKIAVIFAIKCSQNLLPHGFDVEGIYETQGLTGSESGFFNTAWGLAARGHSVDAYCLVKKEYLNYPKLDGVNVLPMTTSNQLPTDYDAIIAWNDPTHLPMKKPKGIRICSQQINDFSISNLGYDRKTDFYAFPSEVHRKFMVESQNMKPEKTTVIPNSTNVEFFEPGAERKPYSMIYCSSPDRGLHRLLDIFPLVRQRVPEATLKIFYRFWPWYDAVKDNLDLHGTRAHHIKRKLEELGENGENGLYMVGPVPNKQIARELSTTQLLVYPCTTIKFTEGFSISTLDGCAAGCLPVISDVDALGSIYTGHCEVIPGPVWKQLDLWADTVARLLTNEDERRMKADRARAFAQGFSRENVAAMWEKFIEEKTA